MEQIKEKVKESRTKTCNKRGVKQHLCVTLKCWLTPESWLTPEENVKKHRKVQKRLFQPANGMQSTRLLVEIHNIHVGACIRAISQKTKTTLIFVYFFRCVEGPNVNLYGFRGCEDWAKKEYCVLKDKIQILIEEEVCLFFLSGGLFLF